MAEKRDTKSRKRRMVKKQIGVSEKTAVKVHGHKVTQKQKICLFVLALLILTAVITGVFLRTAIVRKLNKDFEKGETLCRQAEFEEALNITDRISSEYPRFRKMAVSCLRGVCLSRSGHVQEAKTLWEKAVSGNPDNKYYPWCLYELARLREIDGLYNEAVESYLKITSDFEESDIVPEIAMSLGNCYAKTKKWQEAREKYEGLISSSMENSTAEKAKKELGDLNIKLILSPHETEDTEVYEVRAGDSLERIANKRNTTVELIKRANRLTRKMLPLGKRLVLTPANFEIDVDADKNVLTLKLNGRFFKEYPIGTGKFKCTPTGSFKIVNKQIKPVWYAEGGVFPYGHQENILGTRWMGLDKTGYGIHGTTKPETVGKHASRGCIRMYNKDVEELFMLITVGTPVFITGTAASGVEE